MSKQPKTPSDPRAEMLSTGDLKLDRRIIMYKLSIELYTAIVVTGHIFAFWLLKGI